MNLSLVPLAEEHRTPAIDIFNHYVTRSDASFLDTPVTYAAFDRLRQFADGFPAFAVVAEGARVVGFGMLRPHHPMPTFARTAEVSYFLHPDFCRCGAGSLLLGRLLEDGAKKGITTVLAGITATNAASLGFHRKHGFVECGRFKSVLRKNGRDLDVVWMQKMLEPQPPAASGEGPGAVR